MLSNHCRATVDRDSVGAADDCESHKVVFFITPQDSVLEFLEQAILVSPLAHIAGGQATWLIDTEGYGKGCIGVMAQQWSRPRLLIPESTSVTHLFGEREVAIFLRYWCQSDPEAVFEALKTCKELPPKIENRSATHDSKR
jgi:hypothetical protein